MSDDVTKNIFYRPDVEIERHYDTSGVISKTNQTTDDSKEVHTTDLPSTLERAVNTQNELLQIRKVIDIIPPKTAEIIKDIIDKLIFQIEDEKEKIKEIIDNDNKEKDDVVPDDEYQDGSDSGSSGTSTDYDDIPDFWDDPEPINIEVTVVKTKKSSELAYEQYLKDSTAIKEDFAYRLNSVMQDYLYPLVASMGEIGIDDINYLNLEYEGESVTGVNSDDQHLHDTIVKNQTIIEEKNRKFAKTHSANNTLATMMAFDIISQQRVKYYSEEYDLAVTGFNDMHKRNILEKVRKEYEMKYAKAKVNMYKYLDSSVTVTDDILKKTLDLDTSKCYLLSKDVNIYARKRYESTGYQNTTDDTMVDLEKTSTATNTDSKNTVASVKSDSASNNKVNGSNNTTINSMNKTGSSTTTSSSTTSSSTVSASSNSSTANSKTNVGDTTGMTFSDRINILFDNLNKKLF